MLIRKCGINKKVKRDTRFVQFALEYYLSNVKKIIIIIRKANYL